MTSTTSTAQIATLNEIRARFAALVECADEPGAT